MQDKTAELEDQIKKLLEGEEIAIEAAYDLLESAEEPGQALWIFLENIDDKKLSHAFKEEEEQEMGNNYAKMIDGMIDALMKRHLEEAEFYRELWEKVIAGNIMLDKKTEKEYALYRITKNMRIPYYHLQEGLKMTNEEFDDHVKSLNKQVKQVKFIMRSPFQQKTERMSLINEILKSAQNDEERAVLLAVVYTEIERGLVEQLLKMPIKPLRKEKTPE